MLNKLKIRTPILALILFLFSVGQAFAEAKVVVIPMAGDDVDPDIIKALSDRITALENKQHIPSGLVSAFNSETCPTGWKKYLKARGRFVIGLHDGGDLGFARGNEYQNAEMPSHKHQWSFFTSSTKTWKTFDINGSSVNIVDWHDGMDTTGEGYYPISLNDSAPVTSYHTETKSHYPPYVQLLYCEKE